MCIREWPHLIILLGSIDDTAFFFLDIHLLEAFEIHQNHKSNMGSHAATSVLRQALFP